VTINTPDVSLSSRPTLDNGGLRPNQRSGKSSKIMRPASLREVQCLAAQDGFEVIRGKK